MKNNMNMHFFKKIMIFLAHFNEIYMLTNIFITK